MIIWIFAYILSYYYIKYGKCVHMNSKTKIVVLRRRELMIGVIAAIAVIVLLVILIASLINKETKSDNGAAGSKTTSYQTSSVGSSSQNSKSASAKVADTYTPGVYTASLTLNGSPLDIQVTVDKNNINSIEIINMSESVTTMYPMLESSFAELAKAVMESGSTKNITYSSDNKYTSTMLLNAIQAALDKCTIQ